MISSTSISAILNPSTPASQPPQRPKGFFQKTAGFVTQSVTAIASSALIGYATTAVAEYSLNTACQLLHAYGLTESAEQYHLNAPGMAAFTAATVPVFALTNAIFQKAVYSDGVEKNASFKINDAIRMGKAAVQTYAGMKTLEYAYNAATKFIENKALTLGITGALGALSVGEGVHKLRTNENTRVRKVALAEVAGGIMSLAYTSFNLYQYLTAPASLSQWEWSDLGAAASASRYALVCPIELLSKQIFGCMIDNAAVPVIVQKGAEIVALTACLLSAATVAEYLELPGVTPTDPYGTFKYSAYRIGGMFLIEKGASYLIDYFLRIRKQKELEEAIYHPVESVKQSRQKTEDAIRVQNSRFIHLNLNP
jgi:hypothetical protein